LLMGVGAGEVRGALAGLYGGVSRLRHGGGGLSLGCAGGRQAVA
jgi:hypothetical protein